MSVSVNTNAIAPIQSVIAVTGSIGVVALGFFLKSSLICAPCTREENNLANVKSVDTFQSQEELEPQGSDEPVPSNTASCICFLSPVHAAAAMFFVFFTMFLISIQFVSNWTGSMQQCFLVKLFNQIAWTGAKSSQYCFFVLRTFFTFQGIQIELPTGEKKNLEVTWQTTQKLLGCVAVFAVISLASGVVIISQTGGVKGGNVQLGTDWVVCAYTSSEFSFSVFLAGLNYFCWNTYIMIIVCGEFLKKLNHVMHADYYNEQKEKLLWYQVLLTGASLFSSYAAVFAILVIPWNLGDYLAPFCDMLLNVGVISALISDQFTLGMVVGKSH